MKKRNSSKSKPEADFSIGKGVFLKNQVLMLIISVLALVIISCVAYSSSLNQSSYFYLTIVTFSLVSFAGGYYSGYKVHENGLIVGLLFCLPVNLLISFVSLAVNGFKADITLLISFVILLICSMLGGVLSVNTKKKPKFNRKGRKQ